MKRMLTVSIGAALAAAVLMALLGCDNAGIAEGTTEAGNPTVFGTIYDAAGQGTAARVRLVPEAYRNGGPGDDHPYAFEARADRGGAFRFTDVANGRYNLLAAREEGAGLLLARGINIVRDTDLTSPAYAARAPGAVRVDLSPVPANAQGFIYLLGTDVSQAVEGEDRARGYAVLAPVPSGSLPSIWFSLNGHPRSDDILLSAGVAAAPGDTADAPSAGLPKSGVTLLNPPSADSALIDSVLGPQAAAPVTDFPLLLRLDSSNFDFSRSQAQGRDARFTDRAGRPLNAAIESWDSAAGRASVWINVDTVRQNAVDNAIFLRIGGDLADTAANAPEVFAPERGWRGVWHFAEAGAGGRSYGEDATWGGAWKGAPGWGGFAWVRDGIAGGGARFDGVGDELGTSRTAPVTEDYTVSAWIRTTTRSGGLLFGFAQRTPGPGDREIWMDNLGRINLHVWTGPDSHLAINKGGAYNDGLWHHLAVTQGGGRITLYLDGKAAVSYASAIGGAPESEGTWTIGNGCLARDLAHRPYSLHFQGEIDEARVSAAARCAAWIGLSFETQKPLAITRGAP